MSIESPLPSPEQSVEETIGKRTNWTRSAIDKTFDVADAGMDLGATVVGRVARMGGIAVYRLGRAILGRS